MAVKKSTRVLKSMDDQEIMLINILSDARVTQKQKFRAMAEGIDFVLVRKDSSAFHVAGSEEIC